MPEGFKQGDPLVVCRSNLREDLQASYSKLQLKAYYVGFAASLCGRRHDKIIFDIHGVNMSHAEYVSFWRWVAESVMTCTPVKGAEFVFV